MYMTHIVDNTIEEDIKITNIKRHPRDIAFDNFRENKNGFIAIVYKGSINNEDYEAIAAKRFHKIPHVSLSSYIKEWTDKLYKVAIYEIYHPGPAICRYTDISTNTIYNLDQDENREIIRDVTLARHKVMKSYYDIISL